MEDVGKDIPRRRTKDFEEIPGGKVKRRVDRHIRGGLDNNGETAYNKSLNIREKDEKRIVKQQVEEGTEDYEEEKLELDDMFSEVEIEDEPDVTKVTYTPIGGSKLLSNFNKIKAGFHERGETSADYRGELSGIKERLVEQERVIAKILKGLYIRICENPDKIDDLSAYVKEESKGYLTDSQTTQLTLGIDGYREKHAAVDNFYDVYPENDLYHVCFGVFPNGKVHVVKGPMTLFFQIYNPEDYTRAFYNNKVASGISIEEPERKFAALTGGGAVGYVNEPQLSGTLTIENSSQNSFDYRRVVRAHEDQHQFNKLFIPIVRELRDKELILKAIGEGDDPERTRRLFIDMFIKRFRRAIGMDSRARDEILAFTADGRSPDDIYEILATNKLYDYANDYEENIPAIPARLNLTMKDFAEKNPHLKGYLADVMSSIDNTDVKARSDYFFGDGYRADLRKWIDVVKDLKGNGFSTYEIIAMFYSEPTLHWRSVARRAKEHVTHNAHTL